MNFGVLIPIVAILATAGVITQYLRYLQSSNARAGTANDIEKARLAEENEILKRNLARLEQRLAVLERIATDPAERTAREIESLR